MHRIQIAHDDCYVYDLTSVFLWRIYVVLKLKCYGIILCLPWSPFICYF